MRSSKPNRSPSEKPIGKNVEKSIEKNIKKNQVKALVKETLKHYATYINAYRLLRLFKPKVRFQFEKGNYTVKTVESGSELEQVLRLRHEVFHKEFMNKKLPLALDFDKFDSCGDHLVILDKESNLIVGTYRLICSEYSKSFYSASEFHLDSFFATPGIKLEMSRACIHKDYRDGVVISLLWRGLVQYLQTVKADYLFGLASIRTMDIKEIGSICAYLKQNDFITNEFDISPVPGYQLHEPIPETPEANPEKGRDLVPPLFNSYLRAGAKTVVVPALDESFECIDYLTILRVKDISKLYDRRYTQTGKSDSE